MKRKQVWKKNLDRLTPKQLAKYDDSLEVLRMMRSGTSFNKATKTVRISPPTVKKFLGNTLRKRKKRIKAKEHDLLIRKMKIYENGKQISIQIRGIQRAKLIGKYHSVVGQFTDKNDKTALKQFENQILKDIFWKTHRFETEPEKILEILLKQEEREFFEIYASGGT